jgi:tetratricopeptide (TPR) repeat protein
MQKSFLYIAFLLLSLTSFAQKKEDDFTMRLRDKKEMEYESTLIEASKQTMLGNTTEAMNLYMQCLSLNPESTTSMYEMARLFLNNKDFDASISLMAKAVSLNPQNEWYNLFLLQLYKQKKQFEKAEVICENLIKINPSKDMNYYELAGVYLEERKFGKAESLYKEIESKWGYSATLFEEKVKLSLMQNKADKAIKLLKSLIEKTPDEQRYYLVLVDIFKQTHKTDKAIEIAKSYINQFLDADDMHLELFDLYYSKPDTTAALSELRTIISSPSIPFEDKTKLLTKISTGAVIKSISKYEDEFTLALVKQNPENPDVLLSRAKYCMKVDKLEEAKTDFYLLYKKDKSNADAIENLLNIEIKLNNWNAVYELCTQSILFFPANANLYFYAGVSACQIEKYNESINYLMSGAAYVTSSEMKGQFYQYLGESYYKIKDFTKCYYFFDKSISANPTDVVALNNYSYYLSLVKDSLKKALEMTKLCNKLKPNDATFLDTYAWVLFKLERYSEAKTKIEEAMTNGGSSITEIVEHYGDILFKNSMVNEAIENWIKAKGLGGKSETLDKKITLKQYIE